MFTRIQIEGFGPHASTDLAIPRGWVEFAGPSGTGKTTATVGALLFALFGLGPDGSPVDLGNVRLGAGRAAVDLTAATGTVISRSIRNDAARTTTRSVERHGGMTSCRSEDQLRANLGPVAATRLEDGTWRADAIRAELSRIVLTPDAWRGLLQRDLGRPLRDLLLAVLPTTDLRVALAEHMVAAGHELRSDDPADEKGAKAALTAANRGASEAAGRAKEATAALDRLGTDVPAAPDPARVAAAEAVLAAAREWDAFDQQIQRHEANAARLAGAIAARDAWRAQRAALGDRPTYDATALDAARVALDAAVAAASKAGGIVGEAKSKLAGLQAQRPALVRQVEEARAAYKKARESGDTCTECGRPGHPKHAERMAELEATGKARTAALEHLDEQIAAAESELAQFQSDAATAAGRSASASAKLRELEASLAPVQTWDRELRALGQEPAVPGETQAPGKPTTDRPTAEGLADAQRLARSAAEVAGAIRQRERDLAQAQARATDAARLEALATAEAARVALLLDLVRKLPSELAAEQAEALGDTGPVRFRFPPAANRNTPVIEVMFEDDRGAVLDVSLASDGWRVVVDAWVRATVRRLAGLDALPLVIDRAQDWTGEWPDFAGPVWLLTSATTDSGGIEVRPMGEGAEGAEGAA